MLINLYYTTKNIIENTSYNNTILNNIYYNTSLDIFKISILMFVFITFLFLLYPFIYYLFFCDEKMYYNKFKSICIKNSIICFVISAFLALNGNFEFYVTITGSIAYYLININLFSLLIGKVYIPINNNS